MSTTTLIQLVSEQTLPNVLPALALKPAHIVLCHTQRTTNQCEWIRTALEKAGLRFTLQTRALSDIPSLAETGNLLQTAIAAATAAAAPPIVNFTGGTKLMSIGAFVAAFKTKTPSLYVDTEHLLFQDGETGEFPLALRDNFAALQRIESQLTLDVVAAANGVEFISAGLDPSPFIPLALHLLHNPNEEEALHEYLKKFNPRWPKEVLAFLQTPLPANVISPAAASLAASAGILEKRDENWYFRRPDSLAKLEPWANGERYESKEAWFAAFASLQIAINFLKGGWWELSVLDTARRSGQFRDLRWSVTVTVGGQTFEKDLIALSGLNLALFSCKRGGDKARLVGALDELDSNARQIGGTHSRRIFCIAKPLSKENLDPVRERASQTRTTLIGPAGRLVPSNFVSLT